MTTANELIAGIRKAQRALLERGVVPSQVEVTSAQYEALKEHCKRMGVIETSTHDSILGLRIVINDHPHR